MRKTAQGVAAAVLLLFVALFSFLVSFNTPTFADALDVLIISSGGTLDATATGYKLHDIKGQSVIGELSGANTIAYLGGIYLFGRNVIPGVWPWGTVPLYISREGDSVGSSVIMTWEVTAWDMGKVESPEVYILTGDGSGAFKTDPNSWTKATGLKANTTTFVITDESQVGTGNAEKYYKAVVPTFAEQTVPASGQTCLHDAWAVGKVNINTINNKYVFCSVPFQISGETIVNIIGGQLPNNTQVLYWDTSSPNPNNCAYANPAVFSGLWTGNLQKMQIGEGLLVRAEADKIFTIVGNINQGTFTDRVLSANYYNIFGYPYPVVIDFSGLGIIPNNNDQLLNWNVNNQVYDTAIVFDGTNWSSAEGQKMLLGVPKFYRSETQKKYSNSLITKP